MAGPERSESRQLLKHWKRFRGGKRLPDQDDIRMDELADYLPNLFTLDIESDDRFIVKQLGEALLEHFNGFDPRGHNLIELSQPAFQDRFRSRIRMIFEFGYAACSHTGVPTLDGRQKRTENLLLPVEAKAGAFRQVFGALYYVDGPDPTAQHILVSEGISFLDESFIDLGSGYAAIINANELPLSTFPGNSDQKK